MPEQANGEDNTHQILVGHAAACLEQLLRAGGDRRRGSVVVASGGLTVRVSVSPTPPPRHSRPVPFVAPNLKLTDCERDCWELLGQLTREQRRAGAGSIRELLEARGLGVYALITVKRSLARLHNRLRLIDHSRKSPAGYWRPDVTPLFESLRDAEQPIPAAS